MEGAPRGFNATHADEFNRALLDFPERWERGAAASGYGPPVTGQRARPDAAAQVLERHPSLDDRFDPAIRVVDPDPAWPAAAASELRRIGDALGPVAVRLEHVGSTAVPGLAAKPILDLQVSVVAMEPRERYVEPLERLGYLFAPTPESPDRHFFGRPPERPRTHHVHVCEAGSATESRHVAFRDFLRAHPGEARSYAALKRELAARHPQDRLAYVAGKQAHVVALEARAVRWVRGRERHDGS